VTNYVIALAIFLFVSLISYVFHTVKEAGREEQRVKQIEIVLEEQEKDAKILSRSNDDPDELLDRMRSEND